MLRRPLLCVSFAVLGLVLVGCGAGGVQDLIDDYSGGGGGATPAATMSTAELAFAEEVLALVNQERTARQLAPLVWDDACADAAYAHAVDMDVRGFFDHSSPDGKDPGDRLRAAGVSTSGWGENIARGQGSPQAVMDAWMSSDGHRANILNGAWRRLGVGVHLGVDGPWWVQDFVTP